MKIFILALLFGMSVQAGEVRQIIASYTNSHDLKLEQSAVRVTLMYPGKNLNGNCGVEIRFDNQSDGEKIEKLSNELQVKDAFIVTPVVSIKDRRTIHFDLTEASDSYLTDFTLATKSGKSLKQAISDILGDYAEASLIATSCGN